MSAFTEAYKKLFPEPLVRDVYGIKKRGSAIDRRCCKCGDPFCAMEYDRIFKRLAMKCMCCGYTWSQPTLDSQASEAGERNG